MERLGRAMVSLFWPVHASKDMFAGLGRTVNSAGKRHVKAKPGGPVLSQFTTTARHRWVQGQRGVVFRLGRLKVTGSMGGGGGTC